VKRSTLNFQCGDRKGAWWGGIWGQTRNLGDRAFDPPDLPRPRSGGRGRLRHEDIGTGTSPRYGDRHDVRYTDQERSTSNVQLSTFNAVTERAHGGAGYGDRHAIWATGLLTRRTYPGPGQAVEAGCGTRI